MTNIWCCMQMKDVLPGDCINAREATHDALHANMSDAIGNNLM